MSKSWQEMPLGEVLTERQEVPREQDLLTGNIRIIAKIGFSEGKIQLREETNTRTKMILIRPGDLVVSGINAAKGAIAIYGEENKEPVAATIHYGAYTPNKNKVETKYLWWLLRSNTFKELLTRYVPGGIKTELKAKRLLPVPIPLPPLSEQRQIVEKIEKLSSKIEEAKKLRKQTIKEVEAVIDSVLKKFIEEGRKKGWDIANINNCIIDIQPGFACGTKSQDDGIPHLRMNNISTSGDIDISLLWRAPIYPQNIEKYYLRQGDVIFNNTNSIELVGKTALFNLENNSYVFSNHLTRLRVNLKIMVPEWLAFYLKHLWRQGYFKRLCKTWIGQSAINGKMLSTVKISFPPVEKQIFIIKYLNIIQSKINNFRYLQLDVQSKLNALIPSILNKAFKGELN